MLLSLKEILEDAEKIYNTREVILGRADALHQPPYDNPTHSAPDRISSF
mgnify:CR=1 FL=1